MNKLSIGVDIGGTRTKLGLVDLKYGEVIEQLVFSTETHSSEIFLEKIGEVINKFKTVALSLKREIAGIGFGIPGFIFSNGVIDTTYGFVEFMESYPLKKLIKEKFNLPCVLDNDARVVALGESLFGEGKNYNRVLVLTLGTGVGVGFVINGKLNEPLAFAHMAGHITITTNDIACYCGKTGCLESLVSATGLCDMAKRNGWEERYPQTPLTAQDIFVQREKNNELALAIIDQYKSYLRTGIDNYINIYAPDVIILGGGVAKGLVNDLRDLHNPDLLFPYQTYQTEIKTSLLEESSGILGAAALLNP